MPNNDPEIQELNELLEQYRKNAQTLRGQLSKFAEGEKRLEKLNQLDAELNNIQKTKAALRTLGELPDHLPGDPDEVETFPERFVEEFPYPLAIACSRFNQAAEDVDRLRRLDELIWHTIKYLAAISLAQYRSDSPQEEQLRQWLGGLSRSNLEAWVNILDGVCTYYEPQDPLPRVAAELVTGYYDPVSDDSPIARAHRHFTEALDGKKAVRQIDQTTPEIFLRQLAAYRRKRWEATDPNANEAQKLLWILQPALRQFLEAFGLIAKYSLRYIERADRDKQDWVYTMLSFQGCTEPEEPIAHPYRVSNQAEAPAYTVRRLYLCAADDQPLLNLHPILISYLNHLYFLEYNQDNQQISYRPCGQREMYHPPAYIKSFFLTALGAAADTDEEEESINAELNDTTNQLEEEEDKHRFDHMPLSILWTHLSSEGKQAFEIALGEALRIGRFWLGVEFLLMGLSKQHSGIFPRLLRELGLHPGDFRGYWRGFVGVAESERERWRDQDAKAIGAEARPGLLELDVSQLRQAVINGDRPGPIITPRLLAILKDAAKAAKGEPIGHAELVQAVFRHHRALPAQWLFGVAHEAGWSPDKLRQRIDELTELPPEERANLTPPNIIGPRPGPAGPLTQGGSVLQGLGRDLTAEARAGNLGPAEGETARKVIAQIGRILLQKEANNPILVGEPGVGKTAIVEGLAWRLAGQGRQVTAKLADRRVIELSANALTSGTKYRGDLEQRLQKLLAEVKQAKGQTIVFIDEIHAILGGGNSGAISDAIKPALARGELPTIGATTVAEYRQHIEKDGALARRFTPVWLEEPTIEEAIEIARKVANGRLAEHHSVTYLPEAIKTAVILSARYIHDERLPGKAIKILDQAASGLIIPGTLFGGDDEDGPLGNEVTVDDVLEVIANRTNIPLEQLGKTDHQRLQALENRLKNRIIGQDESISQVVRVVKRSGAGLADPRRPQGVFLFAGPTGVGKTELALALTEALFDNEEAIFRLDMSEFMEKHQVARLTGAPPGYVGYDDEGQLTGRLRRYPYSVILLDEIEKAHPEVQHLFLQLFDNGRLTDSQGRLADGRNAIFIMTTNLGAKEALGLASVTKSYQDKLLAAIYDHFTPEFINRIDRIILFDPLDEAALLQIFDRELSPFQERLRSEKRITVEVASAVKQQLVAQVVTQKMGARPLRRLIEDQIISPIIDKLLAGEYQPGTQVTIGQAAALDIQPPPSPLFTPPVELAGLADVGRPAPPRSLQRPASPEAGLPHNERLPEEAQAEFDQHYLTLARRLADQDITLEIDGLAKFFMCSPTAADQKPREGRSIKQAFDDLIEQPLTDMLLEGEIKTGDWIKIDYSSDGPVIKKMGDDAR